jgi:sugar-specific transcriptional regulator TrmB
MDQGQITLQEIIDKLEVEKRRIYDVVNILEAFKVIFRTEKNCY